MPSGVSWRGAVSGGGGGGAQAPPSQQRRPPSFGRRRSTAGDHVDDNDIYRGCRPVGAIRTRCGGLDLTTTAHTGGERLDCIIHSGSNCSRHGTGVVPVAAHRGQKYAATGAGGFQLVYGTCCVCQETTHPLQGGERRVPRVPLRRRPPPSGTPGPASLHGRLRPVFRRGGTHGAGRGNLAFRASSATTTSPGTAAGAFAGPRLRQRGP